MAGVSGVQVPHGPNEPAASVDVSLVVVTCHSQPHLETCLRSFRSEFAADGTSGEVIVVEHSDDADEATTVQALSPDRLIVQPNRGYAAGINRGAAVARGRVLLLANPDVELLPGSLSALLAAVADEESIAGPQLAWDTAGELLLPPAADFSAIGQVHQTLRSRSKLVHRLGTQAWLDGLWRTWSASGPLTVPSLRGALLAVPRAVWQRQGGLPEQYFLYYEETEWLLRAHRAGIRLVLAGDAKVVHRWGHAALKRPDRAQIEARSMELFVRRNYSRLTALTLHLLSRARPTSKPSGLTVSSPQDLPAVDAEMWLVSPESHFCPALGCLNELPTSELTELTATGHWQAMAVARSGSTWRSLGAWNWSA